MKKVFSFEVKSTYFCGDIYRIAAVIYSSKGILLSSFTANYKTDRYIDTITHTNYLDMLIAFSKFYLENKKECDIVIHLSLPEKSCIFKDMYSYGLIDLLDMPYPLIDISGNLQQAGYNPISVEPYNNRNNIDINYLDSDGINNPLYYSKAVALCYISLSKARQFVSA